MVQRLWITRAPLVDDGAPVVCSEPYQPVGSCGSARRIHDQFLAGAQFENVLAGALETKALPASGGAFRHIRR
jgi:hypothetical protein